MESLSKVNSSRPEATPPETEERELLWWQEFSELEQRFSWVQTPAMQRILRGKYVREIVELAGTGGRILELGCGAGWLCIELAKSGANEVCGVDFAASQISIAERRAESAGVKDCVRFKCLDGTKKDVSEDQYDCVVVHAFLHHLDSSEIRRTMASVPGLLKPNGSFIVFEPVLSDHRSVCPSSKWAIVQTELARLASLGQRFRFRRVSQEESRWRAMFARRNWGVPPHGPSPKEMPFVPGELEEYLEPYFRIEQRSVCMALSHLTVQEWLLRELSHPFSTRMLLPWVARAAAWMDKCLLSQAKLPPGLWLFTMFVCHPRIVS